MSEPRGKHTKCSIMRKLNLGKLRCSTASPSNVHSSSSSYTKNQSQATISRFFTSKSRSSDKTSPATAVKRSASGLSHDEDNDDTGSGTNSKKQRVHLDEPMLHDNDDRNHLRLADKELLQPSTMAKLSCFRKDSTLRKASDMNALESVEVSGKRIKSMVVEEGHENRERSTVNDRNQEDEEQMDINTTDIPSKCFNVTQFACSSRPSSKPVSRITHVREKSDNDFSRCSNARTKTAYTPLEVQFLEVKSKHSDVLLFVECGYRYRFFGEDAEIAAKELNIMCHMDHNFQTASIPTHRLHVHVKRLVSKGYKVGIVKQTETAALKAAGDNKSKVFTRELQALYTKTTLVGEDMKTVEDLDETDAVDLGSGYLMCLVEIYQKDSKASSNKRIFGVVAVQPSTGDVMYDEFDDGPSFAELETRFEHISPEELLLPDSVTNSTESFIRDYVSRVQRPEDSIRLERMPDQLFDHTAALNHITEFYDEQNPTRNEELCKVNIVREFQLHDQQETRPALEILLSLPKSVQTCFAALIKYLKDFKLEKVLRLTSNFCKFSIQDKFVKLSGQTLRNLEIFKNQTNGGEKCSLFWVINHTTTAFGRRLLRKWISHPLRNVGEIEERLNAVTELCGPNASCLSALKSLLTQLPDLERGLCTIYHKKCTPAQFVSITKSLVNITKHIQSNQEVATSKIESPLLTSVFTQVPNCLQDVERFLRLLSEKAAKDGDKTKLFEDKTQFPAIMKCSLEIDRIIADLKSHRSEFRQVLRHPSLDYCCVAGNEFLIEVRNTNLKMVPSDWIKISATKQVSRFRTPFVEEKFKLLCQWREQLCVASHEAWVEFLSLFSEGCSRYRRAVHCIATLDCLFSLAVVAKQPGFVRPVVKDSESHIYIKQGRHPVIDHLLPENEQFVPNDTHMNVNGNRCMIITGPNMGGKSSYIKQVALIVILAQAGSFVPAKEVEVGVLDAVFTRMGATDNIYKGQSTFMVELQESSEIIAQATSKSLVILDELGRGTSTHDGTAIAYATLHHFISKVSSLTLFVTHYPSLAELEVIFPSQVSNNHMAFITSQEEHQEDEQSAKDSAEGGETGAVPSVTFLYHLVNGAAARSYGLNVARLAGIPGEILNMAAEKSNELENAILSRRCLKTGFQEIFLNSQVTCESVKQLRNSLGKIAPDGTHTKT